MLKELLNNEIDIDKLADELAEHISVVEQYMDNPVLMEDDHSDLDVLLKQMDAAKRGMSIVSKLKPGEDRGKHASRVMTNMNKIRGRIKTLQRKIKAAEKEQAA